jgi:hypothetical protein
MRATRRTLSRMYSETGNREVAARKVVVKMEVRETREVEKSIALVRDIGAVQWPCRF